MSAERLERPWVKVDKQYVFVDIAAKVRNEAEVMDWMRLHDQYL